MGNTVRYYKKNQQNNINTNTFTNGVRNGTAKIPSIDLTGKEYSISLNFKLINFRRLVKMQQILMLPE